MVVGVLSLAACGSAGSPDQAQAPSAAPSPLTPSSSEPAPTSSFEPNAYVLYIVDGDTIEVDIDDVQESVRLVGIDTPEKTGGYRPAECYGDEASARMKELIHPGDGVYLELDQEARDRYGRLLAYVYRASDGMFLNLEMVAEGYAAAYRYEPNVFHASEFAEAQSYAQDLRIGLWRACGGPDLVLDGS